MHKRSAISHAVTGLIGAGLGVAGTSEVAKRVQKQKVDEARRQAALQAGGAGLAAGLAAPQILQRGNAFLQGIGTLPPMSDPAPQPAYAQAAGPIYMPGLPTKIGRAGFSPARQAMNSVIDMIPTGANSARASKQAPVPALGYDMPPTGGPARPAVPQPAAAPAAPAAAAPPVAAAPAAPAAAAPPVAAAPAAPAAAAPPVAAAPAAAPMSTALVPTGPTSGPVPAAAPAAPVPAAAPAAPAAGRRFRPAVAGAAALGLGGTALGVGAGFSAGNVVGYDQGRRAGVHGGFY